MLTKIYVPSDINLKNLFYIFVLLSEKNLKNLEKNLKNLNREKYEKIDEPWGRA